MDLEIEAFPTQTLPILSSSASLAMGARAHLTKPTLRSPCRFLIVDSELRRLYRCRNRRLWKKVIKAYGSCVHRGFQKDQAGSPGPGEVMEDGQERRQRRSDDSSEHTECWELSGRQRREGSICGRNSAWKSRRRERKCSPSRGHFIFRWGEGHSTGGRGLDVKGPKRPFMPK